MRYCYTRRWAIQLARGRPPSRFTLRIHLAPASTRSVAEPLKPLDFQPARRSPPPGVDATRTKERNSMCTTTKKTPGPLAGLRVIEMGTLLAGPFCGQLLGDFGAEVIKIEPPNQGDPMRDWGQ